MNNDLKSDITNIRELQLQLTKAVDDLEMSLNSFQNMNIQIMRFNDANQELYENSIVLINKLLKLWKL